MNTINESSDIDFDHTLEFRCADRSPSDWDCDLNEQQVTDRSVPADSTVPAPPTSGDTDLTAGPADHDSPVPE